MGRALRPTASVKPPSPPDGHRASGRACSPSGSNPASKVLGLPNKRPILRILNQPCSDRILSNVFSFLLKSFSSAQSVIKEIPLPDQTKSTTRKSLKIRDRLLDTSPRWERHQSMKMIRHQKHESTIPEMIFMTMGHRLKHHFRDILFTELVESPGLSADRDEENFSATQPTWSGMIQHNAFWIW